jgi:hypothetical protein
VPGEEDFNFANFLRQAHRVRSFYAATPDGALIRYSSTGYVYPTR